MGLFLMSLEAVKENEVHSFAAVLRVLGFGDLCIVIVVSIIY